MDLGKILTVIGLVIGVAGQIIGTIDSDKKTEEIIRDQVDKHFE